MLASVPVKPKLTCYAMLLILEEEKLLRLASENFPNIQLSLNLFQHQLILSRKNWQLNCGSRGEKKTEKVSSYYGNRI